jgi:hypothetical protein
MKKHESICTQVYSKATNCKSFEEVKNKLSCVVQE